MAKALLELNNVTALVQHRPLFSDINLTAMAGDVVHISGSNGSGKSTLLRMITGLSSCDKGSISWMGQTIPAGPYFKQACCFIGHKNGLNADFTVSETIAFYHFLLNSAEPDLDGVMLSLDLLEYAEVAVKYLSFGQQRRLSLARLILGQSKLWILDEPYTGIDSEGREIVNTLCLKHVQAGGIVIVTHHGELNNVFSHRVQRLML